MKRSYIILTLLTLALHSCNQERTDQLGQEGVMLFEKGDIRGALAKFEEIIELDSDNAEAYLRKGDCLGLLLDVQGSIKSYTKAIQIDPNNKTAYYNRALAFQDILNIQGTITDYNKAIQIDSENIYDPNNKLIYLNLGITLGQDGQLNKAIIAFSEAIEIDSTYADAYYNKGYAYHLQNMHAEALKNFEKALSLDPNNPDYIDLRDQSLKLRN